MARRPLALFPWVWERDSISPLWAQEEHTLGPVVAETVEALSPWARGLLEMRYWERLTFREIAVRLGKHSRGAAKYHVSKAEEEFKQAFAATYEGYERGRGFGEDL